MLMLEIIAVQEGVVMQVQKHSLIVLNALHIHWAG